MKKRHGGSRPGAGRPKGSKSSKKVKFLGFNIYEEEKRAIEAGAQEEGVTPTLFMVKHSVLAFYGPEA